MRTWCSPNVGNWGYLEGDFTCRWIDMAACASHHLSTPSGTAISQELGHSNVDSGSDSALMTDNGIYKSGPIWGTGKLAIEDLFASCSPSVQFQYSNTQPGQTLSQLW